MKRRWRCRGPLCEAKTWTERSEHLDAQVVLTRRAGADACRQVGELARPVSIVAPSWGVLGDGHVRGGGTRHPLVDDPDRTGRVRLLGVDETPFLEATRDHATIDAIGLVDLERMW